MKRNTLTVKYLPNWKPGSANSDRSPGVPVRNVNYKSATNECGILENVSEMVLLHKSKLEASVT